MQIQLGQFQDVGRDPVADRFLVLAILTERSLSRLVRAIGDQVVRRVEVQVQLSGEVSHLGAPFLPDRVAAGQPDSKRAGVPAYPVLLEQRTAPGVRCRTALGSVRLAGPVRLLKMPRPS